MLCEAAAATLSLNAKAAYFRKKGPTPSGVGPLFKHTTFSSQVLKLHAKLLWRNSILEVLPRKKTQDGAVIQTPQQPLVSDIRTLLTTSCGVQEVNVGCSCDVVDLSPERKVFRS